MAKKKIDPEDINDGHRKKMTSREAEQEDDLLARQQAALPDPNETIIVMDDDTGGDSDVSNAIKTLMGSDIRQKTELSDEEVKHLTILLELAEKYKCQRIVTFCHNYMTLKVSLNRGSRREVVAAFAGLEGMAHRSAGQDIMSRLRGER